MSYEMFNPDKINWLDPKSFDHNGVLYVLPHRFPFLLVDRVLEIKTAKPLKLGMKQADIDEAKKGSFARTIKNVTFNEIQFQGHFPENPVFPGVMTLEAMAQTAAFVVVPFYSFMNGGQYKKFNVALAGFDNVRFRKLIVPGDTIEMKVELKQYKRNLYSFEGQALVDGKLAAESEILAQLL